MPAWIELADYAGRAVIVTCAGGWILIIAVFTYAAMRAAVPLPFVLLQAVRDWGMGVRWWAECQRAEFHRLRAGEAIAAPVPAPHDPAIRPALELLEDAMAVEGDDGTTIPRWERLAESRRTSHKWTGRKWDDATRLLGPHIVKRRGWNGSTLVRPEFGGLGALYESVLDGSAQLSPLPTAPDAEGEGAGSVPGTGE